MKYAIYGALGGAILGAALTAWLAPGVIAWYFNPPVEMGGFSCTAPITWALKRLQWAQLWGFGVGGVLGLVGVWSRTKETCQSSWNNAAMRLRVAAMSRCPRFRPPRSKVSAELSSRGRNISYVPGQAYSHPDRL